MERICARAEKETIASRIDVNDARFLAPENMTEEVRRACREAGEQVPQTIGELAAVIYHSLAQCYAGTVEEIEALTGKQYPKIHNCGRRREMRGLLKPAYRRIHPKDGRGGTDGGDGAWQPCRADDCGGRI